MKILVIAAHPDDEVYGMGGTIAKLSANGNEVHVLIVTEGSTSQYRDDENVDEIIKKKYWEAEEANRVLGVTKVHFGNLSDMRLDSIDHIEVNSVIEKTINEVKPEVVYTHFYGDVNLDHQLVYKSTLVAVRPVPNQTVKELYCYRVPSSTEWAPNTGYMSFMPNVYIDITQSYEKKQKAIEKYQTEIREYPHPRSIKYVEILDCSVGLKCGLGYSEEFMLLRKKVC